MAIMREFFSFNLGEYRSPEHVISNESTEDNVDLLDKDVPMDEPLEINVDNLLREAIPIDEDFDLDINNLLSEDKPIEIIFVPENVSNVHSVEKFVRAEEPLGDVHNSEVTEGL